MSKLTLLPHQKNVLEATKDFDHVGYFLDMGLGKTFVSSEKALGIGLNVLIVCQKSLISTWVEHYQKYYSYSVFNLTVSKEYKSFWACDDKKVGIINYDLIFRRSELSNLKNYTLLLDESSLIRNEQAKRSKFILYKLHPSAVILCSGTMCNGQYERLWSQAHLLGWDISKKLYWQQYIDYHVDTRQGFPLKIVDGYKNVERLKAKLREHGAQFLKTDEVMNLPEQSFIDNYVSTTKEYRKFKKDSIVTLEDGTQLVGETLLTKMLYERQLCGMYCADKLQAFRDLVESTEDRLIVFYNFTAELEALADIAREHDIPFSTVNGSLKDLRAYEYCSDSITFVQYQAGSMGLNMQKANKIIYFTPPLSCENYMQSQKRIHRIGQEKPCFYYRLICKNSVEERIYDALERGVDFTDFLFEQGE